MLLRLLLLLELELEQFADSFRDALSIAAAGDVGEAIRAEDC